MPHTPLGRFGYPTRPLARIGPTEPLKPPEQGEKRMRIRMQSDPLLLHISTSAVILRADKGTHQ